MCAPIHALVVLKGHLIGLGWGWRRKETHACTLLGWKTQCCWRPLHLAIFRGQNTCRTTKKKKKKKIAAVPHMHAFMTVFGLGMIFTFFALLSVYGWWP